MNLDLPQDATVLLVSEAIVPGGLAVYTKSIIAGLDTAGLTHPMLTPKPPSIGLFTPAELKQIHVSKSMTWSTWNPFAFRRMQQWAAAQQPLLIHGLSAVTAPVCAKLAMSLQVPYIITVHHFQSPRGLRIEFNCRAIIAVSEPLRENLVNDARVPKELIRVIPAGIRVPDDSVMKRHDPAQPSVPLVTSIGKLIPRKDFVTFLKACRILIDRLGDHCSFVVAGEGPDEPKLRKMVRELKLDRQVTFCHGSVTHELLLRDTDVYVQCSRTEGFGSMSLQAMAQGVPVVATSTGGLITLIKEGVSGYLVPVGDALQLAERIHTLLIDPDLRRRMGQAARSMASTNYALDSMMQHTFDLYSEALSTAATKVP